MTSGPFEMAIGDTVEVINIAEIAALGNDNLSSIQVLKYYCKKLDEYKTKNYYDFFSKIPNAPKIVNSEFTPLSKQSSGMKIIIY